MNQPKVKVLIANNTLTQIHGEIYQNHVRFFYRLGKDHPDIEFHDIFARRLSIDRFRNYAAQTAIQLDCNYLMFIDDDMKFPFDSFTKLYSQVKKYRIIAALNYIRGYPFKPMAFAGLDNKGGLMDPISDKVIDDAVNKGAVVPCGAIGTAVCLIDVNLFKTTPGPWFVTGPHSTEDIYFCLKAKEYNKNLKIGTHCGVITGHLLEPEVISYNTKKHLMNYEETYMDPVQVEMIKTGDRGAAYIRQNVDPLMDQINELKKAKAKPHTQANRSKK